MHSPYVDSSGDSLPRQSTAINRLAQQQAIDGVEEESEASELRD